jgi:peptidyl-prolyl cis-trans isomerase B (cyclophilin B)
LRLQLRSAILIAVSTLMFLGVVPESTAVEIVDLESLRSLGEGRLAALLASPDEATAARAALAIGRAKLIAGVPLLEGHLSDRRDAVRALSVYGLGLISRGSDATAIAGLARNDPSGAVQVAALDAIGRYQETNRLFPRAEVAAATQLVSVMDLAHSPIVRGRAAIELAPFADGPAGGMVATRLTARFYEERDPAVRQRIMWTVFRRYAINVPLTLLHSGLRDSDETVRIEAVRAFGKLKNRNLVADLQPLLKDPSWRVQEQTAESIRVLEGGPLTQHWKAIPSFVHTPAPVSDPLASLPARPRTSPAPGAPRASDIITSPQLNPTTAEAMTMPAHGPHPRLRIVTTQGNIYVVLYPEWAPLTVTNFLNLMNRGFLDNNPWFRIVPDFVVQTGEQNAVKAPGPGYSIPAEENPLEQNSYIISMGLNYNSKTNTPIRDSAGSEYYITLSPQYHLNHPFTVFGAMSGGFDVLGRLTESDKVIRVERIADVDL